MSMSFVVTGIGTDVGKTVASAIIAQRLQCVYWKPVQSGDLDKLDSDKVAALTSGVQIHPEAIKLTQPMSPHAAAEIDGVKISLDDFKIPFIDESIVIEGAGGILVPLNDEGLCYIDVFEKWGIPVIVVSKHYLGSINHTLMTLEILQYRGVPIHGILFNGEENKSTEQIILKSSGVKMLGRIPIVSDLSHEFIVEQAAALEL